MTHMNIALKAVFFIAAASFFINLARESRAAVYTVTQCGDQDDVTCDADRLAF